MNRLGLDEKSARDHITEADDQRVRWARFMYGRDIRNTMLYDLLLNQSRLTLRTACEILEHLMDAEDFQASAESRTEVERLHLAAGVEVSLVTDPRTQSFEISAAAQDDGSINLIGPYLEDSELEMVTKIALGAPGVREVRYRPGYAPKFETDGFY